MEAKLPDSLRVHQGQNKSLYVIPVRDFILMNGFINCDPIHQRPPVDVNADPSKKTTKSSEIIESMLIGNDIGEIEIAENKESDTHTDTSFTYDSIDGGHRKRAIIAFASDNLRTHKYSICPNAKLWELPEDLRNRFMQYELRFIVFYDMNNADRGRQFRATNTVSAVSEQAMFNSYGRVPYADFVRFKSREFEQISMEAHPFFSYSTGSSTNPNKKIRYEYLDFPNDADLLHDQIVARIGCIVDKGKLSTCGRSDIEKLYESPDSYFTKERMNRLHNETNAVLDFLQAMSKCKKQESKGHKGLSKRDVTQLYRMWFYMKEKYGEFTIRDYKELYLAYRNALSHIETNGSEILVFRDHKNPRTLAEAYRGFMGSHDIEEKVRTTVLWMLNEYKENGYDFVVNAKGNTPFNILDYIIVKDKKRVFSEAQMISQLSDQNNLCWVDGLSLDMKDAEGAHIKAHSEGGKTIKSNLVMVRKIHNRKAGSMNMIEYKKLWESTQIDPNLSDFVDVSQMTNDEFKRYKREVKACL